MAAIRAGMSYGKWKALHPHTPQVEEVPEEPTGEGYKACMICGKMFSTVGVGKATKRYCSQDCYYEAIKLRNKEVYKRRKEN
jgi:hypothetical protein